MCHTSILLLIWMQMTAFPHHTNRTRLTCANYHVCTCALLKRSHSTGIWYRLLFCNQFPECWIGAVQRAQHSFCTHRSISSGHTCKIKRNHHFPNFQNIKGTNVYHAIRIPKYTLASRQQVSFPHFMSILASESFSPTLNSFQFTDFLCHSYSFYL